MGCSSSTSVGVANKKPPDAEKPLEKSCETPDPDLPPTVNILPPEVTLTGENRINSAQSHKSADSGISVPNGTACSSLNQSLQGSSLFRAATMRASMHVDSERILESLRNEGLLEAPQTATTKGGVCFEIPLGNLQTIKSARLPARLQRLEREQPAAQPLTRELLEEKLNKAARRRTRKQRKEQQRLDANAINVPIKVE